MRSSPTLTACLLLLTSVTACQQTARPPAPRPASDVTEADRWRATDESVVGVLKDSPGFSGRGDSRRFGVTHVAFCWLKTPGDAKQRQQLIDASHAFYTIPGVELIAAGTPLPSTRPVVDSSFDVAVVIMFHDESGLRAYDQHPDHRKAVEELLRPLTQKILIYDFKNVPPATKPAPP